MNNKGFAITGILYTLFILFTMILLSTLTTVSFKKGILEKTILGLEDSFKVSDTLDVNTLNIDERKALIKGKYEFIINTTILDDSNVEVPHTIKCYIYLEKDETIPASITATPTASDPNFTLIPSECNKNYTIELDTTKNEMNQLIFKGAYKFEGSE